MGMRTKQKILPKRYVRQVIDVYFLLLCARKGVKEIDVMGFRIFEVDERVCLID